MLLLIVRHAIAMDRGEYQMTVSSDLSQDAGSRDDALRPLTEAGLHKMRKNAKGLKKLLHSPAILLTSPLKRTVQTCEVLAKSWPDAHRFEVKELEPGSHPEKLVDWFRHHEKFTDAPAVLVGHEPQLSTLIGWLLAGAKSFTELKKGGACLIEFDGPPRKQRGELRWLVTPKMLKALN